MKRIWIILVLISTISATGCTNLTAVEDWRILPQKTNSLKAPETTKTSNLKGKTKAKDTKIAIFGQFPKTNISSKLHHTSLKIQTPKSYTSYSPPKFIASGLLTFYRTVLTHGIKTSCPFCITCSAYSVRALREYGLFLGYIMTIDRLIRCNRDAGDKYFLKSSIVKTGNTLQNSLCLVDEPANNNIFDRKDRKK